MQKLVTALIKAQQQFKIIPKNKTNPHFKSKFAGLDDVLTVVLPVLNVNGLAITQITRVIQDKTFLVTELLHESGDKLESVYPLPEASDPQKMGSAITYARRYSLCAILGVVADDDDEGNGAKVTPKIAAPVAADQDQLDERKIIMTRAVKLFDKLGWDQPKRASYVLDKFRKPSSELSIGQLRMLPDHLEAELAAKGDNAAT